MGMIAGLSVTTYYMVVNQPWLRDTFGISSPVQLWWGIDPISAGLFGVPVGFAVIILVSLVTKPPSQDIQALVDYIRYPDLKVHDRSFAASSDRQGKASPKQTHDGL
jgi:cation/acetate symporter